jgi:hypothetical protein
VREASVTLAAAGLSAGSYVGGVVAVTVVVASLATGAWSLRRALLPGWTGPPARVAETVIALGALFGCLHVLGSVGGFRRFVVLAVLVAAGVAMTVVARAFGRRAAPDPVPLVAAPSKRGEVLVAVGAIAVLAAQWAAHTGFALAIGMTHPDTLVYHMPDAVRFVQAGGFVDLHGIGTVTQRYYPYDAELLHALGVMAFGRDVLSPFVNLGWGALALLSAWCVGRSRGLAALTLLGAAVVIGLPALSGTQPGQASNDIVCLALLLASVALLVAGEGKPAPTALAAIAAGLALATKLTVVASVVVMSVGVVVYAWRTHRPRIAVLWSALLLASGGYWFIRNWVLAGSPVPWFPVHLGPLSLSAKVNESGHSVMSYVTDGAVWRDWYLPGLSMSFGHAWPVVLALGVAAGVAVVLRARHALERVAAVAALTGILYYPFSPLSADGHGIAFQYTLRYLTAPLAVAFVLGPIVFASAATFRRIILAAFGALITLNAVSAHHERMLAWPHGQVITAVAAAAVVVFVVVLVVVLGGGRGALRLDARRSRFRVVGAAAVAVIVLVGGWFVQRRALEDRYADDGSPTAAVDAYFRDVHDARVAAFGTNETYPEFGLDLSNDVEKMDDRLSPQPTSCELHRLLRDGRFDYVVLARGFGTAFVPPVEWLTQDAATTTVMQHGTQSVLHIAPDGAPTRDC